MKYTKKTLTTLLQDNGVVITAKSLTALVLLALDNDLITREDVIPQDKGNGNGNSNLNLDTEKRPRGRPRKYPPKEVDPNKVVDPKHHRLRTIRTNPTLVKLTNVSTGEVESYDSLYKACAATRHGSGFFIRNNGKVVDGIIIEVVK